MIFLLLSTAASYLGSADSASLSAVVFARMGTLSILEGSARTWTTPVTDKSHQKKGCMQCGKSCGKMHDKRYAREKKCLAKVTSLFASIRI